MWHFLTYLKAAVMFPRVFSSPAPESFVFLVILYEFVSGLFTTLIIAHYTREMIQNSLLNVVVTQNSPINQSFMWWHLEMGPWDRIRSWDRALMNGISALIAETLENSYTPSPIRGHSKKKAVNKLDTQNLLAPISLTSQTPELWETNVCCLSHAIYCIFL